MPLTHAISRSTWYLLAVIYVSMLAVVATGIWYTGYTAEQSNRKWCGTLRVFHQSYTDNPPQTQTGRDIRANLDKLYDEFHCADVGKP
jgi:hypothetical protein